MMMMQEGLGFWRRDGHLRAKRKESKEGSAKPALLSLARAIIWFLGDEGWGTEMLVHMWYNITCTYPTPRKVNSALY